MINVCVSPVFNSKTQNGIKKGNCVEKTMQQNSTISSCISSDTQET